MRSADFCQMLTDIFSAVKPQLTIMDGILAMEGEGPASGSLRRLGVMLASQDTVALDAVAGKIIGLDPMKVYTTRHAHQRGLGIGDLQLIEVVGECIENVAVGDFKLPAAYGNMFLERVPKVLSKFLSRYLLTRQQVRETRCTGCAECDNACPSGAISIRGKTAIIDQSRCINCMCCHEVCRFGAIVPRRPIARRSLDFAKRILRI
jgi:ferredoxin